MHDQKQRFGDIPKSKFGIIVQYIVHLSILFLCAPSWVPGVNESHYLPKAKHVWDSSFASGGDLFLESHDSHLLATAVAGWLAYVFPLAGVAWIGRVISWLFLVFAWRRLTVRLGLSPLLQPLVFIVWFLAMKYGHWAGEWVVGGFEAKSIAYPCILLGLATIIENRWRQGWLWLALAVAWHPVVGGWAGMTVGVYWLAIPDLVGRLRREAPYLLLAVLVGLIGVVPAAAGLGQTLDPSEKVSPAQVHVYYRLAHHMCPQLFAPERHVSAAINLLVLVATTWSWYRTSGNKRSTSIELTEPPPNGLVSRATQDAGLRFVLWLAWLSVAISVIGLTIDATLSTRRPDIAANLLRFYWFRWSDIAVPLGWGLALGVGFQRSTFAIDSVGKLRPTELGGYFYGLSFIAVSILFLAHANSNLDRKYSEADELVVNSTGPYPVASDRYLDWLAVCQWIEENTPADSLWFTPKYQQTFKWHAGRAEVVAWKDVPQDNRAVVEWYHRIQKTSPPRTKTGEVREWTTAELVKLAKEFRFEWILLDRTYQQSPPSLEIVYPINIENRSFAICRIPAHWLKTDVNIVAESGE